MSKFDILRGLNERLLTLLTTDDVTVTEKRRNWLPRIRQLLQALTRITHQMIEGDASHLSMEEVKLLTASADRIISEMEEEGIPCRGTPGTSMTLTRS